MKKNISFFIFITSLFFGFHKTSLLAEESFFLINNETEEVLLELGPVNVGLTPLCTITILLSVIGYDTGLLIDEMTPIWHFQEGYNAYLESWRAAQDPSSWLKTSCVWYTELLAEKLGLKTIQEYLKVLGYGNQEMAYEDQTLIDADVEKWLWDSSLKISPKEQVSFLQRLVRAKLSVSDYAMQMTKSILFKEEFSNGWKLYGKTGWDLVSELEGEAGWFVGWVEKEDKMFVFAYVKRGKKVDPALRIPRVKQLLKDAAVT